MRLKQKSILSYLVVSFLIGFLLSLIAIITEDIEHSIPIFSGLKTWSHFIGPIIIGVFSSVIGCYLYSINRKNKIALQKLQDTHAEYKAMISNISDVIAIVNIDGIITYKSPNIKQHFGWTAEELIGTPYTNSVHPDDLEKIQAAHKLTLSSENKTNKIKFRYKCKDGDYKTVLLKAINLLSNPTIKGVLMNYHDISDKIEAEKELKANEYRYRTLFENMSDIVCMLDKSGNIIDINKSASDLLEYSKEELLNKNISELVYTEDKDLSNEYLRKLKSDGFYELYEGRVITKTGKVKWIQVNSTAIKANGVIVGSQDILRDVSKKKKMEISLKESTKQLSKLNTTKDKFFSIIAHDLKGPLSSMLGFSELLIKNINNYDKNKTRRFIQLIHGTLENTLHLLNNLLEWAMSQRGNLPFQPKKLMLNELVNEKLSILETYANQKDISLSTTIIEEFEVLADENMLSSILRNLISNAIKFTPNGGKITLSAYKKKNGIKISVKDNGIGMDKQVKESLFNMATNESTKGTNNENGTGLGLILCKEFTLKHGGDIVVESELGKGSEFILTLPLN